jgi:hypothetical protein
MELLVLILANIGFSKINLNAIKTVATNVQKIYRFDKLSQFDNAQLQIPSIFKNEQRISYYHAMMANIINKIHAASAFINRK